MIVTPPVTVECASVTQNHLKRTAYVVSLSGWGKYAFCFTSVNIDISFFHLFRMFLIYVVLSLYFSKNVIPRYSLFSVYFMYFHLLCIICTYVLLYYFKWATHSPTNEKINQSVIHSKRIVFQRIETNVAFININCLSQSE